MDRINSRLDIAEKLISEFEGTVIETIQTEMPEEQRLKNEQIKSSCLIYILKLKLQYFGYLMQRPSPLCPLPMTWSRQGQCLCCAVFSAPALRPPPMGTTSEHFLRSGDFF